MNSFKQQTYKIHLLTKKSYLFIMKSIFNKEEAENLISRAKSITANSLPLWGSMNSTEMFYHCNFTNKQILDGEMDKRKTTFKDFSRKIFALYFLKQFPKNIKGLKRNDAKGKVSQEEFEKEKEEFSNLVRRYYQHKKEISVRHPVFGNLSKKEWGLAVWKHLDHHLRQFGK